MIVVQWSLTEIFVEQQIRLLIKSDPSLLEEYNKIRNFQQRIVFFGRRKLNCNYKIQFALKRWRMLSEYNNSALNEMMSSTGRGVAVCRAERGRLRITKALTRPCSASPETNSRRDTMTPGTR
jgi:hypothetical protein